MEVFIFGSIPFTILFIFIFFRSKYKWNISQGIRNNIALDTFMIYNRLNISSDSWNKLKTIWGFDVQSDLLINDLELIILPSKWTLALFHTQLPRVIKKRTPRKINFNKRNEISILIEDTAFPLGKAKIEFVIETRDIEIKKSIKQHLKKWC